MKTFEVFCFVLGCFELMPCFAQGIIEVSLMIDSMDEFVAQVCNFITKFRMMRRRRIASRRLRRGEGCPRIWEGTEDSVGFGTR